MILAHGLFVVLIVARPSDPIIPCPTGRFPFLHEYQAINCLSTIPLSLLRDTCPFLYPRAAAVPNNFLTAALCTACGFFLTISECNRSRNDFVPSSNSDPGILPNPSTLHV